jgi:hypothetical protein
LIFKKELIRRRSSIWYFRLIPIYSHRDCLKTKPLNGTLHNMFKTEYLNIKIPLAKSKFKILKYRKPAKRFCLLLHSGRENPVPWFSYAVLYLCVCQRQTNFVLSGKLKIWLKSMFMIYGLCRLSNVAFWHCLRTEYKQVIEQANECISLIIKLSTQRHTNLFQTKQYYFRKLQYSEKQEELSN